MTVSTEIAARVRAEMARHSRSSGELAVLLDTSTASISRRMHGHVPFSAAEISAIAEWLDIPVDTLLPTRASA